MQLELTGEQKKAAAALKRALKRCADTNIYIHNCYGHLIAYDGNVVHCVDDKETDIPCGEGHWIDVPINIELGSWADDAHYVHLYDE